ncbi:MAG: Carboxypeptidase regulatory-like domain, partial [Candidatus Eremiobacteraeota bacterium]|nr:Carboxypeptidase regulatory-like domain [Candidatus Eremiobacteraeota bacterium]
MQVFFLRIVSALFGMLLFAAPALAANVTAATATIQGVVRAGGAPLAAATVRISGATTVSTTTDANGVFSATVPPGVYRVDVSKAGYSSAVLNDLAVVGGTSVPVTVALNQADLTSLQTIGRVSTATRGSGSAINTGTAASNFIGA